MKKKVTKKRPSSTTKIPARSRGQRTKARHELIGMTTVKKAADRQLTPAEKVVLNIILEAVHDINFVYAAIPTRLAIGADGLQVQLDTFDRKTGKPCTISFRSDLPPVLTGREHALDWIYACVRDAWVHELNEALFVNGVRRRDLHSDRGGQTIPPPDEAARSELDSFKVQLAHFLMRAT